MTVKILVDRIPFCLSCLSENASHPEINDASAVGAAGQWGSGALTSLITKELLLSLMASLSSYLQQLNFSLHEIERRRHDKKLFRVDQLFYEKLMHI